MFSKILCLMLAVTLNGVNAFDTNFKALLVDCFKKWEELPNKQFTHQFEPIAQDQSLNSKIKKYVNDALTIGLGQGAITKTFNFGSGDITLADFIMQKYRRVPYHNICHGLLVSFYSYTFALDYEKGLVVDKKKTVVPTDKVKIVTLAGLFHDVGHNGYGNGFCGNFDAVPKDLRDTNSLFCYLQYANDACALKAKVRGRYIKNEEKIEENSETTSIPEDERYFDNYLDIEAPVDQAINDAITAIELYATAKDNKPGYFLSNLCQSAELQHAIIAVRAFKKFGIEIDDSFRQQLVSAILLTNMAFYVGPSANPDLVKSGKEYLALVHVADVMVAGEKDVGLALRKQNAFKVNIEFKVETFVNEFSFFKGQLATLPNFIVSQMGFTKDSRDYAEKIYKKVPGATLKAMITEADIFVQGMPKVKLNIKPDFSSKLKEKLGNSKQVKDSVDQFVKDTQTFIGGKDYYPPGIKMKISKEIRDKFFSSSQDKEVTDFINEIVNGQTEFQYEEPKTKPASYDELKETFGQFKDLVKSTITFKRRSINKI